MNLKLKVLLLCLIPSLSFPLTTVQVAESSEDKVVTVGIVTTDGAGRCSGSFVSKHGDILTSAHCFEHGTTMKIFVKLYDGNVYPAILIAKDIQIDLALLHVPELKYTPCFKLGKEVRVGEQVLSFGSPLGLRGIVTVGWIASKPQLLDLVVMFHTAFINPGNSGGPLVNLRGELIGVNRGGLMLNPFVPAQGLFIAIPIQVIRQFLGVECGLSLL